MYIKNNTENGILSYFPYDTRKYLSKINIGSAYEIHIAPDAPICVYFPDGRYFINKGGERTHNLRNAAIISRDEFNKCIELVTGASVYAIKDEIAGGYVTIRGGHRVGICGSAVIRNGEVTFLKNISALNFRLARECIGVSDVIMPYIMKDEVRSTLVISPPGGGKTTMLRDIARNLSLAGKRVSIVDERCELAAMYEGKSSFDLGVSCDVLSGIEKS